jgi:hypothetical protein
VSGRRTLQGGPALKDFFLNVHFGEPFAHCSPGAIHWCGLLVDHSAIGQENAFHPGKSRLGKAIPSILRRAKKSFILD